MSESEREWYREIVCIFIAAKIHNNNSVCKIIDDYDGGANDVQKWKTKKYETLT